MLTPD